MKKGFWLPRQLLLRGWLVTHLLMRRNKQFPSHRLPSFYLFPIPIKPLLPQAMSFLARALHIISPIPWSRREASKQLCGAWLPGRVKPPHTSTSLTGEANCTNPQQATQKTPPPQYYKKKIL